ncbi:MAG: hypothetical protein QNK75_00255 [Crocinitomicaceae bacterium]
MKYLYISLLLILCSFLGFSQETTFNDSMVVITMHNGDKRIGNILSDDGREILFLSKDVGKIYLRKENVQSIVPYKSEDFQIVDGEYRSTGPFTTRYYFTTNALPIKKKENYGMINLYGPEVHFATSDRFSVGLMTTWIASPMMLAMKYSIPTKNPKVNYGLGTLFGTTGYLNQFRGYAGLHWGMVTIGDRSTNFTLSGGFSYIDAGFNIQDDKPGTYYATSNNNGYYYVNVPQQARGIATAPVIGLAGITKIGKKASFFFDAMAFFGQNKRTSSKFFGNGNSSTDFIVVSEDPGMHIVAFFMPGIRFSKSEDRAFQFAAAGVISSRAGNTRSFPIPMCSWFFKF